MRDEVRIPMLAVLAAAAIAPAAAGAQRPTAHGRPAPAPPVAHGHQTPAPSAACTPGTFVQPFLPAGDSNWYTLVPGQEPGSFTGEGWTLTHGARVATDHGDGVLDLPTGGRATSPAICVTADYPKARVRVRNAAGAGGVRVFVSYAGRRSWAQPHATGVVRGHGRAWTLSRRFNVQPSHTSGWQLARFVFVGAGRGSDFALRDLWVDPRMKG